MRSALLVLSARATTLLGRATLLGCAMLLGCASMAVGETRRNVTAFCVGADGVAYAIATQVSSGDRRTDRVCRNAVAQMHHDPAADLPCRMLEFTVHRDR